MHLAVNIDAVGETSLRAAPVRSCKGLISRHIWAIQQVFRRVWVRVSAFAVLATASAVLSQLLAPYIPEMPSLKAGAESVGQILGVLASSMLAVATFSLSIAVSALAAASSTATPRTTSLLEEDRTTQNVLASFIGAFLFSLLGLIALNAKLYNSSGRIILFLVTLAVVVLVIAALIRWIDHLMSFGRMGDTLDRVEKVAAAALNKRLAGPYMGGRPYSGMLPAECFEVPSAQTGYIQHIDMGALQSCAEAMEAKIYLEVMTGSFAAERGVLLMVDGPMPNEAQIATLQGAFSIGKERLFDDDPRFGLIVLSEIASRALSPAVNDPGTAISVLGRLVRILVGWDETFDAEVSFPDVHVPIVTPEDVFEDAFRPIARDGAGMIEVQIRLQKSLAQLSLSVPTAFAVPAAEMSHYALQRAEAANLLEVELEHLRRLAGRIKIAE